MYTKHNVFIFRKVLWNSPIYIFFFSGIFLHSFIRRICWHVCSGPSLLEIIVSGRPSNLTYTNFSSSAHHRLLEKCHFLSSFLTSFFDPFTSSLSLSVSLRPLPALFLTLVIFIPFTAPVSSCPPPTSPVTKQPILDALWGILPQVGIWRGASLHGTACVSDPLQCNASSRSSAQLPSALNEH